MADAGSERIVHGGVAERTLNADGTERSLRIEKAFDADDGVQFQERESDRGIIQIDLAGFQLCLQGQRKRIDVDFESDRQRRRRADARTNAAEVCSFDGFVQLQLAAPKSLVAKGSE